MVRRPAVAGQFYPSNPKRLQDEVDSFLEPDAPKQSALGILCPHAGYPFSGTTAGKVFSRVTISKRMILLGVNHRGTGHPFAMYARGQWETPFGVVDIDEPLAAHLLAACSHLAHDPDAHACEHSLEVELPFLQRLRHDIRIVPILFGSHNAAKLRDIAQAIAKVIREENQSILLLASSDTNHFENQEITEKKDTLAIDAMLARDPERLFKVCEDEQITMCGVAPAFVMLHAVNDLGASKAELIDHRTSADVTGDYSAVVGYAGMSFR
ncbi:MAG: AmmeMemoRadiSam system protein B [Verrucomicrobiae bacterium]|nr:AmmeMemoRadiSam system protein B [Verrucomicrobiae bacterium]